MAAAGIEPAQDATSGAVSGCLKLADGDAEIGKMDAAKRRRRLLGLLLIEMGLISEEQLVEALKAQERTGQPLGEVLVGRGYVTRLAIQDALASQRGVLLKADPGFGGGLRDELIRRESRREPSVAQRPLESEKIAPHAPEEPEVSIAVAAGGRLKWNRNRNQRASWEGCALKLATTSSGSRSSSSNSRRPVAPWPRLSEVCSQRTFRLFGCRLPTLGPPTTSQTPFSRRLDGHGSTSPLEELHFVNEAPWL